MKQYGYFQNDGQEFVITERDIPRHWYNYLWNDEYVTFTSQVGFGEGLAQDDMGRRIKLVKNRNLYVIDAQDGEWWTANGLPIERPYTGYACVHGQGYSTIRQTYKGIATEYTIFVPETGRCEVYSLAVTNQRDTASTLKLIQYLATDLDGAYVPQAYNVCSGGYEKEAAAVYGKCYSPFGTGERRQVLGYLTCDQEPTAYDAQKNAFIGTYGAEIAPKAVLGGGCTNSDCIAEKLCLALEKQVTVEPGQTLCLHFMAGVEYDVCGIQKARRRIFQEIGVEAALESLIKTRLDQIKNVQIHTPNENLDRLLNYGLKHQANMGSRWARVRHNGYRDLTSDCECFGAVNPLLAWERIKRVLSYQYSNGYAPRTFLDGEIRDNNFADNTVWLTFTVYTLVKEIGDLRLLDEEVAFNDGTVATVYEHIKRSVEFLWNFRGLHGLVKVWGGDWNDGLNAAGLKGRGVSVWLSIAWYRANSQFAEIAAWKGRNADEQAAKARGEEMRQIVDEFGWDGEYYLCAYTDEDEKLGSSSCEEGRIYLIPQLWSVLSGIAIDGKEQKAMAAVDRYLDTELGSLVSYPPYSTYYSNIGDMTQKPPGVHENGGVYLHPMAWKLAVECMLKRNEKVEADLDKILPFDKLCEPYVMCNSYFPQITGYRYKTAGQSWRTASGSWLLKSVLQFILGLQPELAGLRLDPCLPPSWTVCRVDRVFREAVYHITYRQEGSAERKTVAEIKVDGTVHDSDILPYEKGREYKVDVVLR